MDFVTTILANVHLFVIVVICLTRKPLRIEVIKKKIHGKSRKLKARWTIEYPPDKPL